MSTIVMDFSKISKMKKRASKKIRYYAFVSLVFLILSVYASLTLAIELSILALVFDIMCWSLFGWNLFTYRMLNLLESVTERID